MRIISIRPGEPDYEHDTLTEKGWREAALLAERTRHWDVTQFYCSPLGCARDTVSFTLKNAGRKAVTEDWLAEFTGRVYHPQSAAAGPPGL